MQRYFWLGIAFVIFLGLMSCTNTRAPFMTQDLTHETWVPLVATDPHLWGKNADTWFYNAEPTALEEQMYALPPSRAVSSINVAVGNFSNIKIEGDFQVQITGTTGENSVTILGPNELTRHVIVNMYGNLLCLSEDKEAHMVEPCEMRKVIVKIAVNHLAGLINNGCGRIEAINIDSSGMVVESSTPGSLYLSGNITLNSLVNSGPGNITIIGANSPGLTVVTSGNGGTTNVSGQINVRSIEHHGTNEINLIGVSSDGLLIDADGSGKIGISGQVTVKDIRVRDNVWLLMPSVNGDMSFIYAYDNAVIGMMGQIHDLTVYTFGMARFFGRYLCTNTAFVRALDNSHVNIAASTRIFVYTDQNGSVYFFGLPGILSEFPHRNGVALSIYEGEASCMVPEVKSYKGEDWEKPEPSLKRHHTDKSPIYFEPNPAPARPPSISPPPTDKKEVDFMSSFRG